MSVVGNVVCTVNTLNSRFRAPCISCAKGTTAVFDCVVSSQRAQLCANMELYVNNIALSDSLRSHVSVVPGGEAETGRHL